MKAAILAKISAIQVIISMGKIYVFTSYNT
jgi:hypothetical protein